MRTKRKLIISSLTVLLAGVAYFGLSVRLTTREVPGAVSMPLPNLQPAFDVLASVRAGGTPVVVAPQHTRLVVSGPKTLQAAESNWLFVRQSATWANGNSALADNLITSLKNSGVLSNSAATNFQTTSTLNGVSYKIKLQTNSSCSPSTACQNITSSAYTGTKNFAHRFKMWRASDGKDALELLFDDVNNPATSNGVLLTYRLGILDSTTSNNEDLIVESYISGASPNRRQTYSWGAAFFSSGANAATTSDRGRVILEEMTVGLKGGGTSSGALCVRIVARTVSQNVNVGCGTGNYYYALAYGQKTLTNFETTALSGLAVNSLTTNGLICGLINLGFGAFNGGGFIGDGLTSSTVANGFPDPSVNGGYPGVQALFNKLNTAPNGTGTYDDTQKSTLDALNANITFHPVGETPGF